MRFKILFRVAVSLLFLSYLILEIDWPSLVHALRSIRPMYFLISLLLAFLNAFVLAQKFRLLMVPTGLYQPFLKLVKINFVSRFYALFLSSAIGHGVIRWYKVTRDQEGRSRFLSVLIVERLTFVFVILGVTAICLNLISGPQLGPLTEKLLPVLWLGLGGVILSCLYFLYAPYSRLINGIFRPLTRALPARAQRRFNSLELSVRYRYDQLLHVLLLALLWHLLFLLRVYLLCLSLAIPLDFLDVTWMASLALLVQVLPISFSGIGLRETVYAFLFKMQGLPPEQGALIGMLFFSQMLLMASTGGALELFPKE